MTNSIGIRSRNQEAQVTGSHVQSTFVDMFCSNTAQTGAHNNVPDNTSPNVYSEVGLIPTFMDIMITLCPAITAVDSEHTFIRRICFTYTQNFFFKDHM
jgi:hypothetical protein